jgi:hypothetical protein
MWHRPLPDADAKGPESDQARAAHKAFMEKRDALYVSASRQDEDPLRTGRFPMEPGWRWR